MDEALGKEPLPDEIERLVIDLFHHLEREGVRTVRVPRRLQARIEAAALPQGKPQPVLDLVQIRRATDPALVQWPTEDSIDAACGLALLIGGNRRLAALGIHLALPQKYCPGDN